jgi:GTP-binding protein
LAAEKSSKRLSSAKAKFIKSSKTLTDCPAPVLPEYAFIGRSNVGKSSLINMITGVKGLAKTSSKPGKTRLINHFIVEDKWYLVDLPGYGYASASKTDIAEWNSFINGYMLGRPNLITAFVLIDSRLPMQKNDKEFMIWLAENQVPFSLIFTKTDKMGKNQLQKNFAAYKKEFLGFWNTLPPYFLTSAETYTGKEELLGYINYTLGLFQLPE